MKISIVIPTRNQARFISDCLDSLVEQSWPEIEVIIQDGLSDDNTQQVVERYVNQYPFVSYFRERDSGQSDGINRGLQRSTGELWTWLCSDDRYANSRALEELATAFIARRRESEEIIGMHGRGIIMNEAGICSSRDFKEYSDIRWSDFQYRFPLYQPSSLLLTSRVQEVGGVDPDLDLAMDLDLFLRMLKGNYIFGFHDYLVAHVRVHKETKTNSRFVETMRVSLQVIKKHYGSIGDPTRSVYLRLWGSTLIRESRLNPFKQSLRVRPGSLLCRCRRAFDSVIGFAAYFVFKLLTLGKKSV